jgi:CDP-paratose 2-epimerase
MRILISGICGFAGSTLARSLVESSAGCEICGFDNFIRPGSESNRAELKRLGVAVRHGDLRSASDLETLPDCDWVIDAAANPSVLAGVDGRTSPRQLVEHNLVGTVNLLEYCRSRRAGFVLLSTSRVYGIEPLSRLPVEERDGAFRLAAGGAATPGASAAGLDETFPTQTPVSLYGATKLAAEALALEYGEAFGLPVFINRCGVLAGAGQFGRADQGIFAYWIHSWVRRRPLRYLGFGGRGLQVRDCLHPRDLVPLLARQFGAPKRAVADRIVNVAGGAGQAMSLRQLSEWCAERLGAHEVGSDPEVRRFDLPWLVLDSAKAARVWDWRPQTPLPAILEEIAGHALARPDWLDLSAPY